MDIPLAHAARIRDDVNLRIVIDRLGKITQWRVLSGHPLLNEGAIRTLQGLRYKPFIREGQPVEVVTTITISYSY